MGLQGIPIYMLLFYKMSVEIPICPASMVIGCISHNVRGFNSPIKRRKAFALYKHLKAKILLIQETHFSQASHPKFFHRNFPQSFYTLHTSKSRCAAIFLHSSLPMEVRKVFRDKDSRYVIVKGVLNNRELTIASVYAPNDLLPCLHPFLSI